MTGVLLSLLFLSLFYNAYLLYKQTHYTENYTHKYIVNEKEVVDTFRIQKKGKKTHLKATRNNIIKIELFDDGKNKTSN
ncbi:hypothetical protein [Bacillus subtilis]|uniref:hypothetical protein n=1 Tax=Bacillus subtilis TaxID=1423 RepID=UPI000A5697B4|nr:hypothetical protein [Bacillus subtilis]